MDAWWPTVREPHRGRSSNRVTFTREIPAPPIRSDIFYAFADSLTHQNLLTMGREDADAVYRGEVSVHIFECQLNMLTLLARYSPRMVAWT
jgi:hypothetical protein